MLWIRLAGCDRDEADDILYEFGLEIRRSRYGGVVRSIELECLGSRGRSGLEAFSCCAALLPAAGRCDDIALKVWPHGRCVFMLNGLGERQAKGNDGYDEAYDEPHSSSQGVVGISVLVG